MINWTLIGAILLPNVGGWLGALTMKGQVRRPDNKAWYQVLRKPSWTPPPWLFGPAWTILYCGIGYASYLVYTQTDGFTEKSVLPLALYGGQLLLNWTWTPIFFAMHKIGLALLHMLVLDILVVACAISFYMTSAATVYFMVPYLGWLSFATCLNYAIWRLNQPASGQKKKRADFK